MSSPDFEIPRRVGIPLILACLVLILWGNDLVSAVVGLAVFIVVVNFTDLFPIE